MRSERAVALLVGYDSTDSDFNVIDKQGGEKKHLLNLTEVPHISNFQTHGGYFSYGEKSIPYDNTYSEIGITENNNGSGSDTGINFKGVPAEAPHNNLQPYIVHYFWRRTA